MTENLFDPAGSSELQKWVLEIKAAHGICHIQALMNRAHSRGYTPGSFYQLYEQEINEGKIRSDELGKVDVISHRSGLR